LSGWGFATVCAPAIYLLVIHNLLNQLQQKELSATVRVQRKALYNCNELLLLLLLLSPFTISQKHSHLPAPAAPQPSDNNKSVSHLNQSCCESLFHNT